VRLEPTRASAGVLTADAAGAATPTA
jgi:hypothetical protein